MNLVLKVKCTKLERLLPNNPTLFEYVNYTCQNLESFLTVYIILKLNKIKVTLIDRKQNPAIHDL